MSTTSAVSTRVTTQSTAMYDGSPRFSARMLDEAIVSAVKVVPMYNQLLFCLYFLHMSQYLL